MANSLKLNRLQSMVQRELTLICQREIRDPQLNMISIHEVRLSSDLSYAKVYYSSLATTDEALLTDITNQYAKQIRTHLAKKMTTYKCPELNFVYDRSLENANHIEDLIKKSNS